MITAIMFFVSVWWWALRGMSDRVIVAWVVSIAAMLFIELLIYDAWSYTQKYK